MADYPYIFLRSLPVNERSVDVIRESTHQRHRREIRSCFSDLPDPTWITFDDLYRVLSSGEPGQYILEGA